MLLGLTLDEKRKWLFDGKGDIGMHKYVFVYMNLFKKETGNCILV